MTLDNIMRLATEMTVVGVLLTAVGLFVGWSSDLVRGKRIDWWPRHAKAMVWGTFASGAMFHLLAEVTGMNQSYCKSYKRLL